MKKILSLLSLLLLGQFLWSQDGLVVESDLSDAEFHAAINPIDTNNIIVATMHGDGINNELRIYYTYDQGNSWQTSEFNGVYPGYSQAGDPVLSFDAAGNAYLVNLSSLGFYSAVLSKSTDGGMSWEYQTNIYLVPPDKPWIAVDQQETSPYFNNIYVPFLNLFEGPVLYTYDESFNLINEISVGPSSQHQPGIAIRKDGEVFVSMVGHGNPNEIYVAQLTNGGEELIHKTLLTSFPDYTLNAPDVSFRYQPTVGIAIDHSGGPYDGRLYVTYTASEQQDPSIFDIFLMYSDDGGQTWSDPKPVHSSIPVGTQQFYSSIFVNDQGVVMIDWYDRRNYAPTSLNTDFYLGISYDGGENFTDLQLNSQSMDFAFVLPAADNFGIGEYHQMVATDHTAIAFWADGRNNDENLNIYMAKVNLDEPTVGVQELGAINANISISSPYPIPTKQEVFLDVTLEKPYRLKTTVLDVNGRNLWESAGNDYLPGTYQLSVPFNFNSGTYIIQVQSDTGYFKSFKVVK